MCHIMSLTTDDDTPNPLLGIIYPLRMMENAQQHDDATTYPEL